MSTGSKGTKTTDFWRWRRRDAPTGAFGRTMSPPAMHGQDGDSESPTFDGIDVDVDLDVGDRPDFVDTSPEIGRHGSD